MNTYILDDFYRVINNGKLFSFPKELYSLLDSIDKQIVPIVVESKPDSEKHVRSTKPKPIVQRNGSWEHVRQFKTTKLETKEGAEKVLQDIRTSLNKISNKNYDTQRDIILLLMKNMIEETEAPEKKEENLANLRKLAQYIFDIASTNKFYAEIYAKLYKELIEINVIFQEILTSFLAQYVGSVKEVCYVDPDKDYELYCQYNKKNDARKATAVFFVYLMKEKVIPVLRILSIMVAFQELGLQYIEEENRTNEVDEITEILFLFLQEGISVFRGCKAEWIWKFVILPNINTISKMNKKDKKSLSSRAIFKYMDMVELVKE